MSMIDDELFARSTQPPLQSFSPLLHAGPSEPVKSGSSVPDEDRPHRRRSSRACLECRVAKVRCFPATSNGADNRRFNSGHEETCRRCVDLGKVCEYTPNRRGRVKGSKNARTLERMRRGSQDPSKAKAPPRRISIKSPSPPDQGPFWARKRSISGVSTLQQDEGSGESSSEGSMMPDLTDPSPISIAESAVRDTDITRKIESDFLDRLGKGFPMGPGDRQEPAMRSVIDAATDVSKDPRESIAKFVSVIEREESLDPSESNHDRHNRLYSPNGSVERSLGFSEAGELRRYGNDNGRPHRPLGKQLCLPPLNLSQQESELFSQWNSEDLETIIRDQSAYFQYGLHGFKRDVAPGLDPVQQGMVTRERATQLFDAYFTYVQPQWAVLDPELHTMEFVESRSALLMSTILAVGATSLATHPLLHNVESRQRCETESLALHAHVAKLNLIVHMTGARSIEILQSDIILSRYTLSPSAHLDENRWARASRIATMASEIGLNLPHRFPPSTRISDPAHRIRWNDLRVKAFMMINEWRMSGFAGVPTVNLAHFDLQRSEVEELNRHGVRDPFAVVPALYSLATMAKEARVRILNVASRTDREFALETEFQYTETLINQWINKWCPVDRPTKTTWHIRHEGMCSHIQLLICLIGAATEFASKGQQETYRRRLARLAIQIFEYALEEPDTHHMTHRAGILPCIAAIILNWTERRDLVLRLALRMAGHPARDRRVPFTFIRSAGHQMLAMLSIQHLRNRGGEVHQGAAPTASSPLNLGQTDFAGAKMEDTQTFTNPLDITFNSAFDFTFPSATNPSLSLDNIWRSTTPNPFQALQTEESTAAMSTDALQQTGALAADQSVDGQRGGDFDFESFLQMTSALSSDQDTLRGILTIGGGNNAAEPTNYPTITLTPTDTGVTFNPGGIMTNTELI